MASRLQRSGLNLDAGVAAVAPVNRSNPPSTPVAPDGTAEPSGARSGAGRTLAALKRHWWLGAVAGIGVLLLAQLASTRDVERRTAELDGLLSRTQGLAIELTRGIGYGGLIHNFKNLVLRADEPGYHRAARADAVRVTAMVDALEGKASNLGVTVTLDSTRDMVASYRSRLDDVQRLHRQGSDADAIDDAVRFDDRYAIREIDSLLDTIAATVSARVERIEQDAVVLSRITIGAMLVLGALVLGLLLTRLQSRRHEREMRAMNRQLEQGNRKLLAANEALQQFAGMVSHDLRTPLRHIGFFSDMSVEDCAEPEAVREHAAIIQDAVGRMNLLIDSLLDFTRAGFTQPQLVPVDVADLVEGVVDELRPAIEASGADIRLHLDGRVMADPELLRRALHNLLGNSMKYVHPDTAPRIELAAGPRNGGIEVSISDNGIGVESRFAERIFEPCQRLHDAQSAYAGSGIGLSLVKAVIDAHGSSIRLDTDYGPGARFVFQLDRAEPLERAEAA